MKITSVKTLENLGRVQLSPNFFMREFLYSEVANFHGLPNIPENPDLAVKIGTHICEELLEPLQETFGRITIRSAYRSPSVNAFCNQQQRKGKSGYSCGSNKGNYAGHIWDIPNAKGIGGTVCITIPSFAARYNQGQISWQALAWWIHDHLNYSAQFYFPINAAFNLSWHETPERIIKSYITPKGTLTAPNMPNHKGTHKDQYANLLP